MIIHIETQLKTPRELLRRHAFNADLLETNSVDVRVVHTAGKPSEGSIPREIGSRSNILMLSCATTIKSRLVRY